MYKTGSDPSNIAESEQLLQLSDSSELENIIGSVIAQNAKVVEDYKKGKENALQFLIGQAMKETKGQANPQIVQKILYKKLKI